MSLATPLYRHAEALRCNCAERQHAHKGAQADDWRHAGNQWSQICQEALCECLPEPLKPIMASRLSRLCYGSYATGDQLCQGPTPASYTEPLVHDGTKGSTAVAARRVARKRRMRFAC